MKKLLSILLAVCILLTVIIALPFTAFAQETDLAASGVKEGDFEYKVEDGKATITKYTGSATDLVIPSTLGGYPVTSIGWPAFSDCTSLTSVVIPNSVTYLGGGTFSGCTSLTSIVIPDSVTRIGDYAFSGCTNLTSVVIPDSVTSIGDAVFLRCTGLTSVVIGNSVICIEPSSFSYCTSLQNITIPDSVTLICSYAFTNCTGLTSVVIGNSVQSFGDCAFMGCTGLTHVVIGNSVTTIGSFAFRGCTGLTSVIIPDSVMGIGYKAFEDCTALKSVVIPDSVIQINSNAFGYYRDSTDNTTKKIDDFTIYGHKGTEAERYAKENGFTFIDLDEPPSDFEYTVSDDGAEITGYTGSETELEIPSTLGGYPVTRIGDGAFEGCTELESVVIPDSVTDIGEQAFFDCTALKSLTVPASVTSIGQYALGYCSEGDNKVKVDGFTICGSKNTAAEKYANDNGFTFVESEPSYIIGDADSDGVISVIDATQIQKKLAQLPVLPGFNEDAARVDGTETLHILDATYIQKWLAKIEVPYPIGQPAA